MKNFQLKYHVPQKKFELFFYTVYKKKLTHDKLLTSHRVPDKINLTEKPATVATVTPY